MDVVYVFRRSEADDLELRSSLRSVANHLPWIRKVFVFGDRPKYLNDDRAVVEHVPWESVAWLSGFRIPVENWFLQTFLVSLWPELSDEFLIFHDDHVLLGDVSDALARRQRVVASAGGGSGRLNFGGPTTFCARRGIRRTTLKR